MPTFYTTPRNWARSAKGEWVYGGFHTDPKCSDLTKTRMPPPVPVYGAQTFQEHSLHLVRLGRYHVGYVCLHCVKQAALKKKAAECAATLEEKPSCSNTSATEAPASAARRGTFLRPSSSPTTEPRTAQ